jgi:putative DNA primase/helicase
MTDKSSGADFLRKVFAHSSEHPVYVCSFTNDRQPNKEHHIITRTPDEITAFAERYDVPGRGTFFGVNTIRFGENKRCKSTIAEITCLHADIDFKNVKEAPEVILAKLRQLCMPPSSVVHSGHGFHCLWLLKESVDGQEYRDEAEEMLRKVANVVAGDPQVAEVSRVLRLPGTTNSKNGDSIPVTVEWCDDGLRYELDDLREWLEEEMPVLTAKPGAGNGACDNDPFARLARDQVSKPPVDVEARLASMVYHGTGDGGIHATQLSVSAALAMQGKTEEEVVAILLPATKAAAGAAWEAEHWSERREINEIKKCFRGWLKKLPEPEEAPEISPEPWQRPVIMLRPDKLPATLRAAQEALKGAGKPVFALDTVLVGPKPIVRPASDGREVLTTRFIPLSTAQLQVWLSEAAQFMKFDKRAKKYLVCDPPAAFAAALLDTPLSWGFDDVRALSSCPIMRPDGTICAEPGYDPATRLYLALDPDLKLPQITAKPTKRQALEALALLEDLLEEFHFEGAPDRAVALAWLMTPALRPAMRVAPMFLFRANVFGSGKSYLVDLGAAIASGEDSAAVIGAGEDNEETEKRLGALLLEGVAHIAVDNVTFDIPGTSIWCHVSERPRLRLRILGVSKAPEIDNAAYLTVTGNNIQGKDDVGRRVLTCTMNVPVERPEKRKFKKNPVQMVLADRGKYLAAIFTIARHYQAARSPDLGDDAFESYGEFVRLVRNPLRFLHAEPNPLHRLDPANNPPYLGAKLDPVKTVDAARDEDPTVCAMRELFDRWPNFWKPDEPAGAYEVYERANERDTQTETLRNPEFRDLLLRACPGHRGGLSSKSIDGWLKRIRGRIIDGKRLVLAAEASARRGRQYWLRDVP